MKKDSFWLDIHVEQVLSGETRLDSIRPDPAIPLFDDLLFKRVKKCSWFFHNMDTGFEDIQIKFEENIFSNFIFTAFFHIDSFLQLSQTFSRNNLVGVISLKSYCFTQKNAIKPLRETKGLECEFVDIKITFSGKSTCFHLIFVKKLHRKLLIKTVLYRNMAHKSQYCSWQALYKINGALNLSAHLISNL